MRVAEAKLEQGDKLARAVARSLFKLMAYKDEYEVARLYTDGNFIAKLSQQFEGNLTLKFNLAPPLFSKKDAKGRLIKQEYGAWVWPLFRLLARLKKLRGTKLDPFGWTQERRMERALIVEYQQVVRDRLAALDAKRLPEAIRIASLPEKVRGFGHVKESAVQAYRADLENAINRYVLPCAEVGMHHAA